MFLTMFRGTAPVNPWGQVSNRPRKMTINIEKIL